MGFFIFLVIVTVIVVVVVIVKRKNDEFYYNQRKQNTTTNFQRESQGNAYTQTNTSIAQTAGTAQRDKLVFVPSKVDEYEDFDTATLIVQVSMGQIAFIAYSYTLSALQIFDRLKSKVEATNCEVYGNYRTLRINDQKAIFFGEYYGEWQCELIYAEEFGFSAVILSSAIWPLDGNESQEELNMRIKLGAVIAAHLKNMVLGDCVIEPMPIPNHTNMFGDGFYVARKEIADAFRKARIVKNYQMKMKAADPSQIPDWYSSAVGKNLTSQIGYSMPHKLV